mgnify:FL=1
MSSKINKSRTNQERLVTLEMASNPPQVSGYNWKAELKDVINLCQRSLELAAQAQRSSGDQRTHLESDVIELQSKEINKLYQLREYRE